MPLKLGTTNIDIPFSKAYLGSVLVYKKGPTYIDTEFTTCPFPREWTEITTNLKYNSTNNYGLWIISATNFYGNSYGCYKAFDGSNSTQWNAGELTDDVTYETLEISCPVLIKPSTIIFRCSSQGNTTNLSKIQGYNEETSTWEDITTITRTGSSAVTRTLNVTTENYYSKFRALCYRYNSSSDIPRVYEFQITAGTIRTEV